MPLGMLRTGAGTRGFGPPGPPSGAVRTAALHGVWLLVASLPWLLPLLAV